MVVAVRRVAAPNEFELPILDEDTGEARAQTIGGRVFETLKQAIVQLHLRPGNPLSEAEVARQLGVSRQPVREAFIKLGEVGFVEIRPQRGTFVRMISIRDIRNVRFVREAIEVAVVRKAALNANADGIGALKANLVKQRTAARAGDHDEFLRQDDVFHRTIARTVDSDYAWRVLETLKAQLDRIRYLSMPDATPMSTLIAQHSAIVEAIVRRSPDEAEAAMRAHVNETLNALARIAQNHPELFTE